MHWENLLREARNSFYSMFFMQFICLTTIVVYCIKPKTTKSHLYLAILSFASITEMLIAEINQMIELKEIKNRHIDQKAMYAYLIIELLCCALYIRQNVRAIISKKIILGSAVLFNIYIIGFELLNPGIKFLPSHIEIIEGLIIIAYCLYFFYELFAAQPNKTLHLESSFWAISGMLILFSAITPLFIFYNYLRANHNPLAKGIYAINHISYSLLFITFIIAILVDRKQFSKTTNS